MPLHVSIFAPSSPFAEDRFEAGRARLLQLGLSVHVSDGVRARAGFLAGHDAHRAQAFERAWLDETIDVLMAARGGYGAHRLLPALEALPPSPNRKLVVGFSDVTVLHAWLRRRGVPSVHGPVVTQLGDLEPPDLERLRAVLTGPWSGLSYEADGPVLRGGEARGKLFGGNLAVLAALLGTPYMPALDGAILLLEDVAEPPYRVDRLLTQLRLSRALDGIAGVVIGDFIGGQAAREGEPDVSEVLAERLSDLGVPVLAGLRVGHGRRNAALPLGVPARLHADQRRLVIEADQ